MIIDLFTPRLREGECKYSIHHDNEFIPPSRNFPLIMIIDLFTSHLSGGEYIFLIHHDNRFIQFQFCMIIYYIMHLSCRGELHNYFILNDTNFYVNFQFTIIMDLFTPRLGEGECKFSIYNAQFIYSPPTSEGG